MNAIEAIEKIQKKIKEAEQQKERLLGRIEQSMDTLKKDHECSSIKEAETKLPGLRKEKSKAETALNSGLVKLQKVYDWETSA